MGLYSRYIMPTIVSCGCSLPPVTELRRKVVPRAQGVVLELGADRQEAGTDERDRNAQKLAGLIRQVERVHQFRTHSTTLQGMLPIVLPNGRPPDSDHR